MKARININSIKDKAMASKKIENKADNIIAKKTEIASKIFLKEFDEHPITKEIESGKDASNYSGTLGGKGNLFSFIGFNAGDQPVKNLRAFIQKEFNFKKIKKEKKGILYRINYPTLDNIKSITPMPWENGRSWVDGVEKGISGLSQYIYRKFIKASRSESGIQNKNSSSGKIFRPKKYMSEIIRKFKENFK